MKKCFYYLLATIFLFNVACSRKKKPVQVKEVITAETLLNSSWDTINLFQSQILLELPFQLKNEKVKIPSNAQSMISSMSNKKYKLANDIYILASEVVLKMNSPDLKGAADGSMRNLSNQSQVSNLKFDENFIEIKGFQGVHQFGTYDEYGTAIKFSNFILIKSSQMISIIVTSRLNNESGQQIKKRIESSILNN